MVTTLQQASQEGNLLSVREHLEQLAASPAGSPSPAAAGTAGENAADATTTTPSAIDAKDAQGNSALMLAIQAGHREIVEELLARGADRSEILASGVAKSQPEILALLEAGMAVEAAPVDVHGGHQLPDGTVSYMHAGYGQPFVPAYAAAPQGYYYEAGQMAPPPPPPHFAPHGPAKGNGPRRGGPNGEQQHGRKESVVNLPPPEVARLIPCRNFPSCRYGDQCAFAHPMAMGNGMPPPPPPGSAAPSGSMSPPPQHAGQQQQMYYQPMPGYGYGPAPGPYGPGPQFYPMPPPPAPHMQYSPNGVPLPIHFQPPHAIPQLPHDASHQQQHMQQHSVNGLAPGAEPFAPHFEQQQQQQQQQQKPVEQTEVVAEQSQPPQQDGAEPTEQANKAAEQASGSAEAAPAPEAAAKGASTPPAVDQTEADKAISAAPAQEQAAKSSAPTTDSQGRPIHRRQSFNSFLHHHAVPFQPGHISAVVDAAGMPVSSSMPSLAGLNGAPSFRGGKAGRGGRGGFNGSSRPREGSNASSRLQCSFYARNMCAYGDKCRFPHIQQDGTDARSAEGQARAYAENRQSSGSANAAPNGANAAQGAGAQSKAKARAGLPAPPQAAFGGVPLGPQLQQQQQQNKKAAAATTTAAPQAKPANGSLPAAPNGTAATTEAAPAAAANGTPAARPSAPAAKPAANGAAQASSSKAGAANGARSGPAPGANGHAKGNGSTSATTAQRKLAAQRVPTVNDFPALPFSPNPTQPGSPALVASAGPSAAASGTTAKVNFSAILSAPAPVKPKPEPKVEAAKPEPAAAAETKADAQKQSNGEQSNGAANGAATESKGSPDDFKVVKPGKKSASSASAAAAAATVAAATAASQQKEHAAASEGFAATGPTAVAA